jgi:hypothetical protein
MGIGLLMGMLLLTVPSPASAQTGSYDSYLNYEGLTRALRTLAGANSSIAELESLASTSEGREIWLLSLGLRGSGDPDQRPALLIVANLEGNHLIGSMAALYVADYLTDSYGSDSEVKALLDNRTVYIVPRLNPDGAERFFTDTDIEFPYKPNPEDEDRDGATDEDPGDDLNGDGFITQMRVSDPEGEWIIDPDEPRLMRRADATRGERGVYKTYIEGRDDDGDGVYNEDGLGGTHLNMNWPHQYPYFADHAGLNMVSEVETRALADFVFTHRNVGLALTFSPYDNLLSATQSRALREPPPDIPEGLVLPPGLTLEDVADFFRVRSAPTALLPQDGPYFKYVSERFGEITGLSGSGASGEAGSWAQFAYYQLGLPSFTTPVWTRPEVTNGNGSGSRAISTQAPRRGGAVNEEAGWLAWFDQSGVRGFVDWTPANHPTLGEIEVGGFVPNACVNPPADQIAEHVGRQAEFARWLAGQGPMVILTETSVEAKGDGVFLITAAVENRGYFPTALAMGTRTRAAPPITLRLLPAEGMQVLSAGNIQQQIRVLEGSGGRSTLSWLVQARRGTRLTLEMLAPQAGGLTTRTLNLR